MDTPIRKMTLEEKENVLLVLNEFSEEHKGNTKAVSDLVVGIKDLTAKVTILLEKKEPVPGAESSVSTLQKSLDAGIIKIYTAVQQIALPTQDMKQLTEKLKETNFLLQHPPSQKTAQHHHIPHILWIAAGLIILLALVCSGWYQTAGKLHQYQQGQLKYRYLKITGKASTKQIIWGVDSLYSAGLVIEDSVTEWETQREKATELSEQLEKNMGEGNTLQQQLDQLKEQQRTREQR